MMQGKPSPAPTQPLLVFPVFPSTEQTREQRLSTAPATKIRRSHPPQSALLYFAGLCHFPRLVAGPATQILASLLLLDVVQPVDPPADSLRRTPIPNSSLLQYAIDIQLKGHQVKSVLHFAIIRSGLLEPASRPDQCRSLHSFASPLAYLFRCLPVLQPRPQFSRTADLATAPSSTSQSRRKFRSPSATPLPVGPPATLRY